MKHKIYMNVCKLTAACATVLLTACATAPTGTPEEQVASRAEQRWKSVIAKDFERAYAFTTSGFKALVTADRYRQRFGSSLTMQAVEVVKVTCTEESRCTARVRIEGKPVFGSANLSTYIDETWLKENGQWWYFFEVKDL